MKTAPKKTAVRHHKIRKHRAKQIIKRARPIHHRVLLHPLTVFLLLCVGVFIVNSTFRAHADTYTVTAKVAAAPLTEAATIVEPLNNSVFTTSTAVVKGTCPDNSYVVLYRNAAMSGVAVCAADNTYQIQTSLYPNSNILKVQDFNITDDPGPTTPEITVTYIPPVVPASETPVTATVTPSPNNPSSPPSASFVTPGNLPLLTSDFTYKTFTSKSSFEWDIEITGGYAPYQFITNWGDGTTSTQKVSTTQVVHAKHRYSKSGNFTVIFKVIDARGNVSLLQIMAIIRSAEGKLVGTSENIGNGSSTFIVTLARLISSHWLAFAWGSYATVLLMAISFWLGEQQKVHVLMNVKRTTRPRTHRHRTA